MLICINLRLVSNRLRVIYESSYCNITPTLYMQQILQKKTQNLSFIRTLYFKIENNKCFFFIIYSLYAFYSYFNGFI